MNTARKLRSRFDIEENNFRRWSREGEREGRARQHV